MDSDITSSLAIHDNKMCNSGECSSAPPVQVYDPLLRVVVISVQAVCIVATFILTFLVFHCRKYKAIAGSAWILLELILIGALLLYSMVVVRYFESSVHLCLLEPWLRELGFTFCYGTIVLKIYRLLVEFRTRKAHRWVVRDKDLLKYWAVMITCVMVYLSSGTMSTLQHSDYSLWNVNGDAAASAGDLTHHAAANTSRPSSFSAKGAITKVEGGIRLRGDNTRTWHTSNASFLVQKARVLRREVDVHAANPPQRAASAAPVASVLIAAEQAEAVTSLNSTSDSAAHINQSLVESLNATEDGSAQTSETHPANHSKCNPSPAVGMTLIVNRSQVDSPDSFHVCRQLWWHYVNMAGEFMFLISGLYISSSARNAASHHGEKLSLFLAILCEFLVSIGYSILSRVSWIVQHADYLFLLEFARSQLATTLVLVIIFGPKLFYICRESSGRDDKRLHHQTSQLDAESVPIPPDSEIFKTQDGTAGATVSANGEIDFGNVDLSQMDPEVIRVMFHEELQRVYTQLHVLKMKTLRKDNPHISKRRGGRKSTHRRFSLQNKTRSARKSEANSAVEETGVEESVCSIDVISSVPAESSTTEGAQSTSLRNPPRF